MFKYTIDFCKSTTHEYKALRDIGFAIFLLQTFVRVFFIGIFAFTYSFFVSWVLRNPGDNTVFLTGLDTINFIHIDRLIVVALVVTFLFLTNLLIEVLGVMSLSRQYYLGEKTSLRKAFKETIKHFRLNSKVQLIRYMIFLAIILVGIFGIFTTVTLFSNIYGVFISIAIFCYMIYALFVTIIHYSDVGQRIFENKNNIYEVYDYRLEPTRKRKIIKYYFFKILLILVVGLAISIVPLFFMWLSSYMIGFFNWGAYILFSLLTIISVVLGTSFSYLIVSFFSLRSTRLYLEHHEKKSELLLEYKEKKYLKYKKTVHCFFGILSLISIFIMSLGYWWYHKEVIIPEKHISIFGHRASMVGETDNSLPALDYAIENKIEYVEIDIQISKDNIPLVFHDASYFDGLKNKYINNTPYSDIKNFDLTTAKNSPSPVVHIPTLEEFLLAAKGKIKVNIEIKPSAGFEDLLAEKTAEIIKKTAMEKEVIVTSFSYEILQKIKQKVAEISTGLVITAYIGEIDEIDNFDVDWLMINDIYFGRYSEIFIAFDKKIAIWSFAEWFDGSSSIYEDIDGAIVNDPAELKQIVDDYNKLSNREKYYKHISYLFSNSSFSILNK